MNCLLWDALCKHLKSFLIDPTFAKIYLNLSELNGSLVKYKIDQHHHFAEVLSVLSQIPNLTQF
jgi:hypothetical protein